MCEHLGIFYKTGKSRKLTQGEITSINHHILLRPGTTITLGHYQTMLSSTTTHNRPQPPTTTHNHPETNAQPPTTTHNHPETNEQPYTITQNHPI